MEPVATVCPAAGSIMRIEPLGTVSEYMGSPVASTRVRSFSIVEYREGERSPGRAGTVGRPRLTSTVTGAPLTARAPASGSVPMTCACGTASWYCCDATGSNPASETMAAACCSVIPEIDGTSP